MIKAIRQLPDGHPMPYLGQEYTLKTTTSMKKPQVKIDTGCLTINFYQSHPQIPVQIPLIKWYRVQAKKYITCRIAFWAEKMQLKYNKIFIKDQESRWGSCSTLNNLNFNWRIVMAPPPVIDYLLIHELAHLKEMNHSARFWSLVSTYDPNYTEHQKWLNDKGKDLFVILPKIPVALLNSVHFYMD
ncbi:MAG: M48 family metallopeptidase [Anaerovibrio sp.]|uniref:M48 family metallopeptidase n=1 Tax=Anaerovibrio sp. TaxID=1872532 RepID=UPI0025D8FB8E|nr:SprT family zinc-dependent metalloprotease [Anaerovibrio sp.]MCR5176676.1 M48 family metallopeptidase [Anaerovibrio sp.]